jgi:hypothetical protein
MHITDAGDAIAVLRRDTETGAVEVDKYDKKWL